jgi:hypothetical protein
MINIQATTIDELVDALDPALLPKLLLAVATELEDVSGAWVEKARVEINAGADEFRAVKEQSIEFNDLAMDVLIAARKLVSFSNEVGAFD